MSKMSKLYYLLTEEGDSFEAHQAREAMPLLCAAIPLIQESLNRDMPTSDEPTGSDLDDDYITWRI